jgi:hypothetical protein
MKLGKKLWEEAVLTPGRESLPEAWRRLYGEHLDISQSRHVWRG